LRYGQNGHFRLQQFVGSIQIRDGNSFALSIYTSL
jgi:hypothetical protein